MLSSDSANGDIYATGLNNYVYQITPGPRNSNISSSATYLGYPIGLIMFLSVIVLAPSTLAIGKREKHPA